MISRLPHGEDKARNVNSRDLFFRSWRAPHGIGEPERPKVSHFASKSTHLSKPQR